ncbi:unnamed protein product [Effrenium voratum]|uniref:Uncharacterized protein n=1 Tax=Effrenium voratum TaxID=2562239 RepID=A0AA36J224_9DINO|nr:unnamed protein product [Effrenium voratum]CAJ1397679.1 unnamed protein product [Effrenium voratum]CAJ1425045.1 unnamed protein product [Effrenium voratum]
MWRWLLPLAAGQQWCELPKELATTLVPWETQEAQLVECLRGVQQALQAVCTQLYQQPGVQGMQAQRWQEAVSAWDVAQKALLRDAAQQPACARRELRSAQPAALLSGASVRFAALARNNAAPRSWLYHFQSTWRMVLKLVEFLQVLSLDGFSMVSDLAYWLHRRAYRQAGQSEQELWSVVAKELPTFRIATDGAPLRHDVGAPFVVDRALAAEKRGQARVVEVGVFQANLSHHLWRRSARLRGQGRVELHLVDHWGAPNVPLLRRGRVVGTGSDMGGQSNASALLKLWRRFEAQGAQGFEVPHWDARACHGLSDALAVGSDLLLHRSTSVGPARCFEDDSLDLVYIDADHKWWSVLQDSSALALQLARVQETRDNSMRVFHCQRGPGEASPREGKWLLSSAIPSNCCVQNQQEQSDAAGQNPISEEGPASSALC